jgi:hypothetical protein
MDPDPDLDPDLELLSSLILRMQKIFVFISVLFSITCPQAHDLQSEKFDFYQYFALKFYFAGILSTHL